MPRPRRRLAEEEAAREKREKKLQRRKEKDEGAGAGGRAGDAPETDDVDVNGKKTYRVGFYTWQGAEGDTRRGGKNGETTRAKCGNNKSGGG